MPNHPEVTDMVERKAWAMGNLVADFKRLLWETPIAQEWAGSKNCCWGTLPSGLAISPIAVFCTGSCLPSQEPECQAPSTHPRLWVRCWVLSSDPDAEVPHSSSSMSPCPSHQLQGHHQCPTTVTWPLGLHYYVPNPSAHCWSARWRPRVADKLITPMEQRWWCTQCCKYNCLRLISVFFLLLSKEEAKIKSFTQSVRL